MTTKQALALVNSVDTKHTAAQPLLRKIIAGEATAEDVDAFVDTDSRWESQRELLKKLARREKLTDEDVAGVNSFADYLKPLFIGLSDGLQPDAA